MDFEVVEGLVPHFEPSLPFPQMNDGADRIIYGHRGHFGGNIDIKKVSFLQLTFQLYKKNIDGE